jgi:hypothetical protein
MRLILWTMLIGYLLVVVVGVYFLIWNDSIFWGIVGVAYTGFGSMCVWDLLHDPEGDE